MRKYVLNKYVITLIIFGLVMLFAGEQGLIRRAHRARQIRELEQRRDHYTREIEQAKQEIETLQNTDSLEKYAREHYLMHADNEDIYLVEEDD